MKKIIFLWVFILVGHSMHAQLPHKTQNIILVTLDGFRWQEVFNGADSSFLANRELVGSTGESKKKYWNDDLMTRRRLLMPFLWETISVKGQIYGNRIKNCRVNVANPYWFSYPGYSEILCGFADKRINSNEYGPNPNITLFESMNKSSEYKGKIAVFGSWDAFNDILNEKRSKIPVNAGIETPDEAGSNCVTALLNKMQTELPDLFGGVRLDAVTFNLGFEYLKTKKPRVLFLAFDETDDFAHGGKYDHYLNSARYEDNFLKEIWNWVQGNPEYRDKTTLFITCDHGRGETAEGWKSHGTETPHSDETWFAVIGPDTPALGEITLGQYYNNQYAKTLAALLGFKYANENMLGEVIPHVIGNMQGDKK
jgi:hypothetical protein